MGQSSIGRARGLALYKAREYLEEKTVMESTYFGSNRASGLAPIPTVDEVGKLREGSLCSWASGGEM
jgi:hypothetical protein